jgi:hypothetical protein
LPATAAAAARRLPALLEPAVARKLLLTVAPRYWILPLNRLLKLAYIRQHLDAAMLKALLHRALPEYPPVAALCQLPEAAQLSDGAVVDLLLAALNNLFIPGAVDYQSINELCKLPAAASISGDALFQVLQVAVVRSSCPWALYKLPAAQQLRSDQAYQLLLSAITCLDEMRVYYDLPEAFYQLPATQKLSSEQLLQLLQAAIAAGKVPTQLFDLPAAADISGKAVHELLRAALRQRGYMRRCIAEILRLPGVGQVTPEAEYALLRTAYECSVKTLCSEFDLASGMPWQIKERLMMLCCALPAGKQLSLQQLLFLWLAVFKDKPAVGMELLCNVQPDLQRPELEEYGSLAAMVAKALDMAVVLCNAE